MRRLVMVSLLLVFSQSLFGQPATYEYYFADGDYLFDYDPGYTAVIRPGDLSPRIETLSVFRHDSLLWTLRDARITILDSDSLGMPKDLTGDKIEDVVVETYSGGAHCCYTQYILSLGPTLVFLDTIDHPGKWTDRDHDGLWEVTAGDLTLDYWKLPHSDSPMPIVVLEASRDGFVPAPEMMLTPEPSASDVLAMLKESRDANAWRDYGPQTEREFMSASLAVLHRQLVDLIYGGHAKLGLELLEIGWPKVVQGHEQYVMDLRETLHKSPYWSAIAELNQGTMFGY